MKLNDFVSIEKVVQDYIELDYLNGQPLQEGSVIEIYNDTFAFPIIRKVHLSHFNYKYTNDNPSILSAVKAYVYVKVDDLSYRLYLSENQNLLCKFHEK